MKFTPPLSTPLSDKAAEALRRNTDQRIREISDLPAVSLVVIPGVVLRNAIRVPVAHRLGRAPRAVLFSAIRCAIGDPLTVGIIRDFGDLGAEPGGTGAIDRSRVFVLQAGGFTSTITVDVVVM